MKNQNNTKFTLAGAFAFGVSKRIHATVATIAAFLFARERVSARTYFFPQLTHIRFDSIWLLFVSGQATGLCNFWHAGTLDDRRETV